MKRAPSERHSCSVCKSEMCGRLTPGYWMCPQCEPPFIVEVPHGSTYREAARKALALRKAESDGARSVG